MKKIVYIRLDGIIADYEKQNPSHQLVRAKILKNIPSIYDLLAPMKGGIEAVITL